MDSFLSNSELAVRFYRSPMCSRYRDLEYELISKPRDISEERYASTSCGVTAELVRYLLSGTIVLETPWIETYGSGSKSDTMYIYADGGDHEFMIHDGKIYDSWFNVHRISIRDAPEEMLSNIRTGQPFTFIRGSDNKEFKYAEYNRLELDRLIDMKEVKKRYRRIITSL